MDRRYKKRIDRYWNKRKQECLATLADVDINGWFDYWHMHLDEKGNGNKHSENFYSSIQLSYELLKETEKLFFQRKNEIQCWATICKNTADNAIFIHSKNPNRANFPNLFDDTEWENEDLEELNCLVDKSTHIIGKALFMGDFYYVIKAR